MAGKNTVEIIISARDQASRAVAAAFGSVESASSKAMGAISTGAKVAGAAMLALTGMIAKVGVSYNAAMEQSLIAWESILRSADKAKDTVKTLQVMGAKTPFEFEGLDKSAKLLSMAGFEGKNLFETLTKVGDAVSAIGGGDEELQGVSMALFQISTKGKISAQEMNQLAERGIPAWELLSKAMKMPIKDVMKLSEQGKLFAKEALPMIIDGMGNRFKGSMEKQSHTFNGMMSTLRDNLKMLSAELTKPLFEKLKKGLEVVLPILDKFRQGLKDGGMRGALAAIFPPSIMSVIDTFAKGLGMVKEGLGGVFAILGGNTGGGISMLSRIGLSPDAIQLVVGAVSKVREALSILKGAFAMLTSDSSIGGITIMTKLGLSPETITKVVQVVNGIKTAISNFIANVKNLFTGDGGWAESIGKVFETAKSIIMPILTDIVAFVRDRIAMIKQFWDENGAQIMEAIKNVWAGIAAVFQFIAPVILFILQTLWANVKGVIDGALKIIMGLIKVFAGLFTGDWSKMWEGLKQLVVGALQFIWNFVNLLLIGKLIGSIKAFVTQGITHFTGFWTKAVEIFKNLDTHLFNIAKSLVTKVIGFFKNLYTQGASIFNTLKTFGANTFQAMWTAIKTVASNLASGVKDKFLSMVTGAKFHMDGLLNKAKTIFNNIKNAITNPIETAKNTISGIISKIKGLFSGIKVSIPLPHFQLQTTTKSIMGKTFTFPTGVDVDWYDKGGVFYGPQVIGVGERRPEVVGALSDIKAYVKEAINEVGLNNNGNNNPLPQYAVINIDGRQAMLAMIDYIEEEQALRNKRWT